MKQLPVYISGNMKAFKVNAPIYSHSEPRWLGPVGHIVESEYDGVKSRYYWPDRSQGLPQPGRGWQWAQGCE